MRFAPLLVLLLAPLPAPARPGQPASPAVSGPTSAAPPPAIAARSPAAPPPRRPAVIVSAGALLNALRAGDGAAAAVAAGLRWPLLDVQWSLGFPALSLFWQARVSVLRNRWVVPYLTTGLAIAYNNGTGRRATLSVAGGAGLRARLLWKLQLYAEVLANEVLLDSLPAGPHEPRTFSLPVVIGATLEL